MKKLLLILICLFVSSGSVFSLELNCKFHSFFFEVNGEKTNHEIDEEDIISIYYEPKNQWLWDYPINALQDDINVWKKENNYSYNKSDDFASSNRKYKQKNAQLNIESKRQEIPKEFHRSRAFKLVSKMNLPLITDNLFIYNYYEKKVTVTRNAKCN